MMHFVHTLVAVVQQTAPAKLQVEADWGARFVSFIGLFVMLLIGWAFSYDRKTIPWRIIAWGLALQIIFALIILKTAVGAAFFTGVNSLVASLLAFTVEGARFLFGNLVFNSVPVGAGDPGMAPMTPTAGMVANTGAFFAFNVLPTIIFFSSLMTLLYYLGIMQRVVKGVAWVMMRTMKTSGAETLVAAGNIFVGQTEAPLLVKPFVKDMTTSEMMTVMTAGMGTIAAGVMAAYVGMLMGVFPDVAGHLMAASVMSAPAAIIFAKLMLPEKEVALTRDTLHVEVEKTDANVIDAAARGASDGLGMALNVGAMLLAFIALIAIINSLLGWAGDITHLTSMLRSNGLIAATDRLSLQNILGWVLSPLAWLMGVPWKDAVTVGSLIGVKTAVNEFVGYLQLSSAIGTAHLSPRSIIIATYALCGFSNFSSIAIQMGGIGAIAPNKRGEMARLGMRALLAGSLTCFMTACIAGMLI